MPKTVSGKYIVKILTREYGFFVASQKGSHLKLKKITTHREIVTIVPMHREVARGTLRGILELAEIEYRDFQKFM